MLAEAGIEVVGENRAQDLEAKHERYGDAFRWHFIGHLQSRKAKMVNGICELVHSLACESAARRLTVPALVEVNLSGEESKSGVAPEELEAFLGVVRRRPRPDDDAAARRTTLRARARTSAGCASSRKPTVCGSSRWARARITASRRTRERRSFALAQSSYGR